MRIWRGESVGAEGGVRLGAYRGVAVGALGVWLGVYLGCGWGCIWGAPGVYLGSTGVDGTEVPCIRRWEEVWVEGDDRAKSFRCNT